MQPVEVADIEPPPLIRQNSGFAFLHQRTDWWNQVLKTADQVEKSGIYASSSNLQKFVHKNLVYLLRSYLLYIFLLAQTTI